MNKDPGEYLTLGHETIRKAIHDNLVARGLYSARMYMNVSLSIEKQIICQNNKSNIQSDKYHITTTAHLYTIPEIDTFINHCIETVYKRSDSELANVEGSGWSIRKIDKIQFAICRQEAGIIAN